MADRFRRALRALEKYSTDVPQPKRGVEDYIGA